MREEPEFRLWTEGGWRCEYWIVTEKGELRLFCNNQLQRSQSIEGGKAALAMAQQWRVLLLRDNPRLG
jgi:hypothetical protein